MGGFCRLLFDMRDISVPAVADGIENLLGTTVREGQTGMRWELYVVTAEKV